MAVALVGLAPSIVLEVERERVARGWRRAVVDGAVSLTVVCDDAASELEGPVTS